MSGAELRPLAPAVGGERSRAGILWLLPLALLIVVLVPQVRVWRGREAQISAAQNRVGELARATASQTQLDSVIRQQEAKLSSRPQRVLRSRSRALAASALQSLVQQLAETSNVTVTRLDVANSVAEGDIPISLAANGDIYGLAELLRQIRGAPVVVTVDKLQTQNNSALRGAPDVLQIVLSLHAPVIVQ